jgi:uncharacterized protein DUF4054
LDVATFQIDYPEFRSAGVPLMQSWLDRAALELNATAFGVAYDEAHGLLAAHKGAISPAGRASRLVNDKGETTYEVEFRAVCARAITALSVVGGEVAVPCP